MLEWWRGWNRSWRCRACSIDNDTSDGEMANSAAQNLMWWERGVLTWLNWLAGFTPFLTGEISGSPRVRIDHHELCHECNHLWLFHFDSWSQNIFKNVTFECFFTAPEKNYFVSAGISITYQFAERVNIESWCRQLLCIIVRGLMLNKNLFSVFCSRSKDCKLLIKHL